MIHITEEAGNLKLGVNFYPITDKASLGFRIRTKKNLYRFRWSKIRNRFNYEHVRIE